MSDTFTWNKGRVANTQGTSVHSSSYHKIRFEGRSKEECRDFCVKQEDTVGMLYTKVPTGKSYGINCACLTKRDMEGIVSKSCLARKDDIPGDFYYALKDNSTLMVKPCVSEPFKKTYTGFKIQDPSWVISRESPNPTTVQDDAESCNQYCSAAYMCGHISGHLGNAHCDGAVFEPAKIEGNCRCIPKYE
jgi:hypothetical protein